LSNSQPKILIAASKFQQKIEDTDYYQKIPNQWKMEDVAAFLDVKVHLPEDDRVFRKEQYIHIKCFFGIVSTPRCL